MYKLTPEERIQRANAQIMRNPSTVLYSSIVMLGETRLDPSIPTAATNGVNKFYNPDFIMTLSDQQLVFLVLHEAGHVLYQHLTLWRHLWKEDADRANRAADYYINNELVKLAKREPGFIQVPPMALVDKRYDGMNTQEIFNKLEKDGGSGDGFDEHRIEDLSEEEQKDLSRQVEQAIRQGVLLAGKMGGDQSKEVNALLAPKVDWKEQLRDFMSAACAGSDDSTWRKPNRRWLHQDLYMPSAITETVGSVAVVLDTSGSVDAHLASLFLSEVRALCEVASPDLVHLIECDAQVQNHTVLDRENFHQIEQIKSLRGGGGTDMMTALDYIKEKQIKPDVALVLTDGYSPWGTAPEFPLLIGCTTDVRIPIGVVIRVKE